VKTVRERGGAVVADGEEEAVGLMVRDGVWKAREAR